MTKKCVRFGCEEKATKTYRWDSPDLCSKDYKLCMGLDEIGSLEFSDDKNKNMVAEDFQNIAEILSGLAWRIVKREGREAEPLKFEIVNDVAYSMKMMYEFFDEDKFKKTFWDYYGTEEG